MRFMDPWSVISVISYKTVCYCICVLEKLVFSLQDGFLEERLALREISEA